MQTVAAIGYPFELLQEIGRGGLGIVYLAYHHRLQKHVVLKRVSTERLRLDKLRIEVDLLKNLHHSYLPQVYDFVQVGNDVFTVMEYIEGVSLVHYLKESVRLPQDQLMRWLRQLCEVLEYLHSHEPPVIHSDIKPENIMITPRGDVCLIDFNVSQGEASSTLLGLSQCYASPEQFALARQSQAQRDGTATTLRHSSRQGLTPQSDIYSLGATFYWLILAVRPMQTICPLPPLEDYDLPYDQAFLRVIDKTVDTQGKQFTSATKLLEALDNLQRFDARYQGNRRLQWIVGGASTILLLAGFLLSLYGWSLMRYTEFQDAYDGFKQLVNNGTNDAILSRGYQILNDRALSDVLKERPADKAAILHALGDCYFQNGEYAEALPFYAEALAWGKETEAKGTFYRDYAIVLARMGSYDEALSILEDAASRGIAEGQLSLIRAEIAYAKGEEQTAFDLISSVVTSGGDAELSQRAYILESRVYDAQGDWQNSLESLRHANTALSTPITLRRLADAYARYASVPGARNQKDSLLKEARSYYEALCVLPQPLPDDRLNLAIVNRSLGDYSTSERMLKELLNEGSGDYRIAMNLAFLYEMTGDDANAQSYCSRALREYGNTPQESRESRDSANIQALENISRRLG